MGHLSTKRQEVQSPTPPRVHRSAADTSLLAECTTAVLSYWDLNWISSAACCDIFLNFLTQSQALEALPLLQLLDETPECPPLAIYRLQWLCRVQEQGNYTVSSKGNCLFIILMSLEEAK